MYFFKSLKLLRVVLFVWQPVVEEVVSLSLIATYADGISLKLKSKFSPLYLNDWVDLFLIIKVARQIRKYTLPSKW